MYGWEEAEALKLTVFDLTPEPKRAETITLLELLSRRETANPYETQRIARNGRTLDVWVTLTALVNDANQPVAVATTERDITERNRITQRLLFGNRALKALNLWYKTLLTQAEPVSQAAEACRILVEEAGYRLAWVGRVENNKVRNLSPVFWGGLTEGESQPGYIARSLAKTAQKPIENALDSRHPVAVRNILTDPVQEDGRADARRCQYKSFIVLPLIHCDDRLGVLSIYASEPGAFEEQEVENLSILSESMAMTLGLVWKLPGTSIE
jgi:PAS domain S-box-containing protein